MSGEISHKGIIKALSAQRILVEIINESACSACHARHQFSIEMARKPYTCMECHIGPDVPAFKVYSASKHGNIFSAMNKSWDFEAVPWTIGKDFTAPTCATCHVSLLVGADNEVVVERSHQMNNRIASRIERGGAVESSWRAIERSVPTQRSSPFSSSGNASTSRSR